MCLYRRSVRTGPYGSQNKIQKKQTQLSFHCELLCYDTKHTCKVRYDTIVCIVVHDIVKNTYGMELTFMFILKCKNY